jgi:hypothetical protein
MTGFHFTVKAKNFFFAIMFRPALERIRPPIQLALVFFLRQQSGRGIEADTHHHLMLMLRIRAGIIPLPHKCILGWYFVKHGDNAT